MLPFTKRARRGSLPGDSLEQGREEGSWVADRTSTARTIFSSASWKPALVPSPDPTPSVPVSARPCAGYCHPAWVTAEPAAPGGASRLVSEQKPTGSPPAPVRPEGGHDAHTERVSVPDVCTYTFFSSFFRLPWWDPLISCPQNSYLLNFPGIEGFSEITLNFLPILEAGPSPFDQQAYPDCWGHCAKATQRVWWAF